jgi:ATP-dependent DNA helicase RecG
MPDEPLQLTTPIEAVHGVGPHRGAAFRKLGIRCIADLLRHLPMRYEDELPEQSIEGIDEAIGPEHESAANVTVRGEVMACRPRRGRQPRYEATVTDGTGTLMAVWFNAPWMQNKIFPDMQVRLTGRAKRYGDILQMANPQMEVIEPDAEVRERPHRHRPIYPATEHLSPRVIGDTVEQVLDEAVKLVEDHLHEAYRRDRALLVLSEAYRKIHRPAVPTEAADALRRLAFDELLMLQLGVMMKRRHRRETLTAPALKHNEAIDEHIRARFPFTLTQAQESVIEDIVGDVTNSTPMNRLLQGDVGAGKTVIAVYLMLLSVASGCQAALMAPTELLAEQHFASMAKMLEGSNVRFELLTGSLTEKQRRSVLERAESGELDLVIGTHALLTEQVSFANLAAVIIDEQHRFGVHQRFALRSKRGEKTSSPHVLVMTATPIPRTLSLTAFGDLDISTIRTLPPGRMPIITRWATGARSAEVYEFAAKQLKAGDQAYIVVPAIDESSAGLKDVQSHLAMLQAGPMKGCRLEAMHGRLSRDERAAIMERFRAGEIQAIVATTVIEVGVDVENATIMIIEQADRFGLAQLHQLRGRVGRGGRQSLCTLIADPTTEDGRARLNAITETTDGFVIAERDLEIRGPGELFGARQSGLPPFFAANLPRDMELLQLARRDARAWIDENPLLEGERDALLRKRLLKTHGEALGLGDVA